MADEQRSIFDVIGELFSQEDVHTKQSHIKIKKEHKWILRIDGASRGNPGQAGVGIFITKDEIVHLQEGYYIGKKTNNEAEYLALVLGLFLLKEVMNGQDSLTVISDSELLIKQMKKIYKVKKPELQILYSCVQILLENKKPVFKHVLREYNQKADVLANKGVDTKHSVPLTFLDFLAQHNYFM